jgi:L-fuconolactonase
MPRIDAHQHFWKFNPERDSWINDDMRAIRRDFYPQDLQPLLHAHAFEGCISVQADQSKVENDFLLSMAAGNDFIRGIVGWVDLRAPDLQEQLSSCKGSKLIKGFRHVLQGEQQRDFMLRADFMKGISMLQRYDYTYDILIYPDQLEYTKTFIQAFPDQPFVLDHIAKPYIRDKKLTEWKKEMINVSKFENVYCKVSGMVTEAEWYRWEKSDFHPYLDVVLEAFGPSRLMFGSDWPVCLVAASYTSAVNIVEEYFASLTKDEQDDIFGNTAAKFYNL